MTMIEVMIAVVILTLCSGMLASTLTSTRLQRRTSQEREVAMEAARGVIEDMHNLSFASVFVSYNADPLDDPGGPGTAPGNGFAVVGLNPIDGDPDGLAGEVIFPSASSPLLENIQDSVLGMPRDLNGDLKIDALDHTADHILLPLRVVVEWKGIGGERRFEVQTMLADLRRVD